MLFLFFGEKGVFAGLVSILKIGVLNFFMKEVEVLVKLRESVDEALGNLEHLGSGEMVKVFDVYYHNVETGKCSPDDEGCLGECVRLRRKGGEVYVTYKLDHFGEDGVWVYSDEHETKVDDFDVMDKIICGSGLDRLAEIENRKYIFLTEDYEVVLEDVSGLGIFLEVERLRVTDDEDVLRVKDEIRGFVGGLGFAGYEEMNEGKLGLMLRKMRGNV